MGVARGGSSTFSAFIPPTISIMLTTTTDPPLVNILLFFVLLLGICILNWIRVHCFCYNVVPLLQYQVQLYQIHLF